MRQSLAFSVTHSGMFEASFRPVMNFASVCVTVISFPFVNFLPACTSAGSTHQELNRPGQLVSNAIQELERTSAVGDAVVGRQHQPHFLAQYRLAASIGPEDFLDAAHP